MIDTERTRLRPFTTSDAEELFAVFRDAEVRKYLLDDSLVSAGWVNDEIAASDLRFATGSAGLWSIRLAVDDNIVGFVGFREFFNPPQLQLLYGLLPSYWGRGLATEAAARVCDYAFRHLGFTEIAAAMDAPNERSRAVLHRLGFRARPAGFAGNVTNTAFFSVDRRDWKDGASFEGESWN